jgi:hypothetical protein
VPSDNTYDHVCRQGPMVRIHLPPAGSPQTFGPSRVAGRRPGPEPSRARGSDGARDPQRTRRGTSSLRRSRAPVVTVYKHHDGWPNSTRCASRSAHRNRVNRRPSVCRGMRRHLAIGAARGWSRGSLELQPDDSLKNKIGKKFLRRVHSLTINSAEG